MKFQKHLLLLLTLLILTSQVRANNTEISNKDKSKHFVSFGIGKTEGDWKIDEDSGTMNNSSTLSLEFGQDLGVYNNIQFKGSFEFSNIKLDDIGTDLKLPFLGTNLYAVSNIGSFNPYLGIGFVVDIGAKVKIKDEISSFIDTMSSSSNTFGYQIKLGTLYNINEKLFAGIEYKQLNMDFDIDQINETDIEDFSIDCDMKIKTFLFRFGMKF